MKIARIKAVCSVLALALAALAPVSAPALDMDNNLDRGVDAGCADNVTLPASRSKPAPDAIKVLPPAKGVYIGTYQIPAQPRGVSRFANALGQMPPIVLSFHDFFSEGNKSNRPDKTLLDPMEGDGSPNVIDMAKFLNSQGSVLALSWAVYCCDYEALGFWMRTKKPYKHFNSILAGEQDAFIRQSARQIKEIGGPIMLTIVPEFSWQGMFLFGKNGRQWIDAPKNICNQYGDPAWPDGPERVRDTFRHVIDIFREEGVKNVTWFMYAGSNYMSPLVDMQSKWLHPKYYYPGDDYMDWVGQSQYFTEAAWKGDFEDVLTFEEALDPGYRAWREVTNKPIFLTEFGLTAHPNQDRSQMWNKLLSQQLKNYPAVKAITIGDTPLFEQYFDVPMLSTRPNEVSTVKKAAAANGIGPAPLRLSR